MITNLSKIEQETILLDNILLSRKELGNEAFRDWLAYQENQINSLFLSMFGSNNHMPVLFMAYGFAAIQEKLVSLVKQESN